eukprot:1822202-Prymnesium_polylepis.1
MEVCGYVGEVRACEKEASERERAVRSHGTPHGTTVTCAVDERAPYARRAGARQALVSHANTPYARTAPAGPSRVVTSCHMGCHVGVMGCHVGVIWGRHVGSSRGVVT